jgi:outer membrane protein assembly factor BamB
MHPTKFRSRFVFFATCLGVLSGCSKSASSPSASPDGPLEEAKIAAAVGGDDLPPPKTFSAAAAWPMYRGDQALTGYTDEKILLPLKLRWTFKAGDRLKASPAVAGGKLYGGNDDGVFFALNAADGKRLWTFSAGSKIESSPAVHGGRVFFGTYDGTLFILDAQNGKELGRYKTGDKIVGSPNWLPGAAADEFRIFIGSHDCRLHCLDSSGNLLWKYKTEYFLNGAAACDGENLIFGGCDAIVHVVSAKDGRGVARIELSDKAHVAGSAALADRRAYLGHYQNQFLCVDLAAREIVWRFEMEAPCFASPALAPGKVVFGGHDQKIYCLSTADGEELWAYETRDKVKSDPVICADTVFCGSDDGRFYALALADGEELWSYELGGASTGSPAVAGGLIFISSEDGHVYAFEGATTP